MAFIENVTDFTIRHRGHPKFKSDKIIEDDIIEVIVQKLEMLLFTNTKEVIGENGFDFGMNLEYLLWETKIPNIIIEGRLNKQINKWIPELNKMGYDMELILHEGEVRDILVLEFFIKGYNVAFVFN